MSLAIALALTCGACVQRAVLENQIQLAQLRARTLASASDLEIAEAALGSQLVELEALYQRAPDDARVLDLLSLGYSRMALGFIEAQRLEALAAGDSAGAAYQAERREHALLRAAYYRKAGVPARAPPGFELGRLRDAQAACQAHDRPRYERELSKVLAAPETSAESRLDDALSRRHAKSWLAPALAARCGFP